MVNSIYPNPITTVPQAQSGPHSLIKDTIVVTVVSALSLISANAVERQSLVLAVTLRCFAAGSILVWIFRRCVSNSNDNYPDDYHDSSPSYSSFGHRNNLQHISTAPIIHVVQNPSIVNPVPIDRSSSSVGMRPVPSNRDSSLGMRSVANDRSSSSAGMRSVPSSRDSSSGMRSVANDRSSSSVGMRSVPSSRDSSSGIRPVANDRSSSSAGMRSVPSSRDASAGMRSVANDRSSSSAGMRSVPERR